MGQSEDILFYALLAVASAKTKEQARKTALDALDKYKKSHPAMISWSGYQTWSVPCRASRKK
jgi:hypothetical protein